MRVKLEHYIAERRFPQHEQKLWKDTLDWCQDRGQAWEWMPDDFRRRVINTIDTVYELETYNEVMSCVSTS